MAWFPRTRLPTGYYPTGGFPEAIYSTGGYPIVQTPEQSVLRLLTGLAVMLFNVRPSPVAVSP